MADLLTYITQGVTFVWGLFQTLFSFMVDRPVILYAVFLPLVIGVFGIIIRVIRKLGLRSGRR